jgi:hypothetical protein
MPAAIERARAAFHAALATSAVAAIADSRDALRAAQVEREAARENLASVSAQRRMDGGGRMTPGDAHRAAIAAEAAAAELVSAKRATVRRAVEDAAARVQSDLAAPLDVIQREIFELLTRIEEACDPLTELQADLNRHGLAVPALAASAAPMLEHVRAIRRIAGGR